MRIILALLTTTTALLLMTPAEALADCCNIQMSADGACNVFGCNCDGPCSNFGVSCSGGPTTVAGVPGFCPGYDWCDDLKGFCNGSKCVNSACYSCGPSRAAEAEAVGGAATPMTAAATASVAAVKPADSWAKQSPEERFSSIDTDKDNKISSKEFLAWLKKNVTSMSRADGNVAFKRLDANANGVVDLEEFDADLARSKAKKK